MHPFKMLEGAFRLTGVLRTQIFSKSAVYWEDAACTTLESAEVFSLSSPKGGEGWGEEAHSACGWRARQQLDAPLVGTTLGPGRFELGN
jgi:hypothetical protein